MPEVVGTVEQTQVQAPTPAEQVAEAAKALQQVPVVRSDFATIGEWIGHLDTQVQLLKANPLRYGHGTVLDTEKAYARMFGVYESVAEDFGPEAFNALMTKAPAGKHVERLEEVNRAIQACLVYATEHKYDAMIERIRMRLESEVVRVFKMAQDAAGVEDGEVGYHGSYSYTKESGFALRLVARNSEGNEIGKFTVGKISTGKAGDADAGPSAGKGRVKGSFTITHTDGRVQENVSGADVVRYWAKEGHARSIELLENTDGLTSKDPAKATNAARWVRKMLEKGVHPAVKRVSFVQKDEGEDAGEAEKPAE